jgi:uncharacterized protein (DUF488 family)
MILYTIGFSGKSAERFFQLLAENDVRRVVDIRLKPRGQLSGFSKQDDLAYFLKRLNDCDYVHLPELAPTEEMMETFRNARRPDEFRERFDALMDERGIPERLNRRLFEDSGACLLCSEAEPEHCHRRFVADLIALAWEDVEIRHLV